MLQNNPGDRGLELVGNKDWTELTAVGTGPSVVCCVPPHACRSLQMQLRVHKLPAVSADPAAQASAPRMAPIRHQPPAPGLLCLPPRSWKPGEVPTRPPQGPPFAVSTLCTHTSLLGSLQPRNSQAAECTGHGTAGTEPHPVQLCPLPAPRLLTWESHHEGILCRLHYLSVAD